MTAWQDRRCYADLEERVVSLEEFARRADMSVYAAYDLLTNLYDATEDSERRLLTGWIAGSTTTQSGDGYHYGPKDAESNVWPFVRRRTAEDDRFRDRYERYMNRAANTWGTIIRQMDKDGVHASVWQTGGMCLAIGATLSDHDGRYLMATDSGGALGPDRTDYGDDAAHWVVGLYEERDGDEHGTCITLNYRADRAEDDVPFAKEYAALAKAWIAGKHEYP